MMKLTHFSLFSGIGGIDLAAEWAGFETVGQCEWADYPTMVLEKHWPQVPKWRDIKSVTANDFLLQTGKPSVDLISGGFPCQPFSIAGQKNGTTDSRYLWPEMLRVIQELKPTWVLGENVANFINMALEETCIGLEDSGYEVQSFVIPALSVNAPHRRDRVFIVGHLSDTDSLRYKRIKRSPENTGKINEWKESSSWPVAKLFDDIDWIKRAKQSCFLGANDGLSNRLDRIKCLGNAVVPQQVYPILKAIAEIENAKQISQEDSI